MMWDQNVVVERAMRLDIDSSADLIVSNRSIAIRAMLSKSNLFQRLTRNKQDIVEAIDCDLYMAVAVLRLMKTKKKQTNTQKALVAN